MRVLAPADTPIFHCFVIVRFENSECSWLVIPMEQIAIFFIVTAAVFLAAYAVRYAYQQDVDQQKSLEKQGNIPDCVKWVADAVDRGQALKILCDQAPALSYKATNSFLTPSRWSLCWNREQCVRATALLRGLQFELPKAFRFVLVVMAGQAKAMKSCALLTKES